MIASLVFFEPLLSYQKTGRRSVLAAAPQIKHQQDQSKQAAADGIGFHRMKHVVDGLDVLIEEINPQSPKCGPGGGSIR